jgi:hypothetical protein
LAQWSFRAGFAVFFSKESKNSILHVNRRRRWARQSGNPPPSQWNVDDSAMKDFRLNERHALQFRMEMFNAPNEPAWGTPTGDR